MPFNTTLYLCTRVWMYFTMCQIPLTRANTPRNSRSCTNSCTSSNFERSTHFGNELQTQIDSSLWTSQVILIDQLIVFYKWYHEWYNFQCYHSDYHQRHISFQIRFLLSDKIISSKTRKKKTDISFEERLISIQSFLIPTNWNHIQIANRGIFWLSFSSSPLLLPSWWNFTNDPPVSSAGYRVKIFFKRRETN